MAGTTDDLLDALTFDLEGWTRDPRVEALFAERMVTRAWSNADRDVLTEHFFQMPPDLPKPFPPIDEYRRSVQGTRAVPSGGGVVSIRAGVEPENGLFLLQQIFKAPQKPTGMAYTASLTLPFTRWSWVVMVRCPEGSMTGMREAAVFNDWWPTQPKPPGPPQQAMQALLDRFRADPYRPDWREGALRTIADDKKYDARFPAHPLSRARRHLERLRTSLRLDPTLAKAPPFPRSE